jgi:CheY-like chemotaxis protein
MKPTLFLADDNPGDAVLLELAFADAAREVEIIHARDGRRAWEMLRQAAATTPFPYNLIVLDLNLPVLTGLELLDRMRGEPALAGVPTVFFTSSTNPADRHRAMLKNPDAYLIKPADYRGLGAVVEALSGYLYPRAG